MKNLEIKKNIEDYKEFKINDYITLKLEYVEGDINTAPGWSTVIYVKGKRFKQCKYLLLNIPVDDISSFDRIQSVDEAAEEVRDRFLKKYGNDYWVDYNEDDESVEKIPPEVEFWGHCSNMQVWYENNYDTRLLHRWLAFPLLKKLTEVGDPVAKKVFKEEIAKRYASGHPSVVETLRNGGFMDYLSSDEIGGIIDELKSKEVKTEYVTYKRRVCIFMINGRLNMRKCRIEDISEIEGLNLLKDLKRLDLSYNQISEIKGLEDLENLEFLGLINNRISEIKGLEKLKNLITLFLQDNQITEIKGLEKLKNLENLALANNKISEIKGLKTLHKLDTLGLKSNLISPRIIDELGGLDSLGLAKATQNFVKYCKKN